ncbi:Isoaspartyl peptidase precursor [Stieleria maiorica]|uniref:Isoaspartyl peptidase n=1 Tax=Stieleria maiorica TaxID=2795974 RepID=A0A5B9MT74_9BACT|nr:isoaspartyl peptidase/L-asparaginase [Stieleria maiorica]QEG02258.1 Isoaspartyl peptidase precursor [Stieleria maiorica]
MIRTISVVMVVLMVSTCIESPTTNPAHAQTAGPTRWAIAIHGGAGGDPSKWNDEKRSARREGLEAALTIGRDLLAGGGSALDAVEAVIRSMEDNASFNAGRGAVLTKEGNAELDASIMDGRTRACGAIAGVTTIKNPISTARLVMTETKHVLLAGPGADAFAASQNVPLVDPKYFLSRRPGRSNSSTDTGQDPHFGTVGCVALDSAGNLAAGTSTGGTAKKLPGRVGDSPIVGAGTFADNASCAVSGTGVGEEYIRNAVAYDISAQMLYAGLSLESAVTEVMTERLKPGIGGLICVSHDGQIVMQHNTPGMSCGAADSGGRFETQLVLDNGGRPESNDAADDLPVAGHTDDADETAIRRLIDRQADAWNAGDIDRFMDAYWKNERLTFVSGGNVTRGWDSTRDRYRQRYPDQEAMGSVAFSDLEFLRLDDDAFQVLGVWTLKRDDEDLGGRFTLVFRRQPEGWRIVHDHTSVQNPQ